MENEFNAKLAYESLHKDRPYLPKWDELTRKEIDKFRRNWHDIQWLLGDFYLAHKHQPSKG